MKESRSDRRGVRSTPEVAGDRAPDQAAPVRNGAEPRPWLLAAAWSLIAVAVLVAGSALVNPLLGRYVHWGRIEVGAPIAYLVLALALRRRWV